MNEGAGAHRGAGAAAVLEEHAGAGFRTPTTTRGAYGWIEAVLRRFEYRVKLPAQTARRCWRICNARAAGRAQVNTAGVARWSRASHWSRATAPRNTPSRPLQRGRRGLLAEVDRAMGTLSGPPRACVLRRQRCLRRRTLPAAWLDLGGHLYNLRASAGYRAQRVIADKTPGDPGRHGGVRRRPRPRVGRASSTASTACTRAIKTAPRARITSTRWTASRQAGGGHRADDLERRTCARDRADAPAVPVRDRGFPRRQRQRRYVNHAVARMLDRSCASSSPQPPRHSNDWRLAETKNGAVVRKESATCTSRSATLRASTPTAAVPQPVPELPPTVSVRHRQARPEQTRTHQARVPPEDAMTSWTSWRACPEANRQLRGGHHA